MKKHLINHTLLLSYTLVFAGLLFGVYMTSGALYFPKLFIYFASLAICYAGFNSKPLRFFVERQLKRFAARKWELPLNYVLLGVLAFISVHFIYLKGSPALQALNLYYVEDVSLLRNSITEDAPRLISYLSSITIRALLPFLLFYLIVKKRFLVYWLVFAVAVFYSFSLMQKSYVIGLLLPSMIYCLFSRKYLLAFKDFLAIGAVVVGLVLVSSPPGSKMIPQNLPDQSEQVVQPPKVERIAQGLYNRVLILPGEIVSEWFRLIPAEKPFLAGDGYRLVAKLRGHPFVNYSVDLYKVLYPEYVAQGLNGTVNVASFMYDYANFGTSGLILAGFLLALLLVIMELIFKEDLVGKMSINIFPILLLSSGALTTLLFSGGWGFLILMYYLFLYNNNQKACVE